MLVIQKVVHNKRMLNITWLISKIKNSKNYLEVLNQFKFIMILKVNKSMTIWNKFNQYQVAIAARSQFHYRQNKSNQSVNLSTLQCIKTTKARKVIEFTIATILNIIKCRLNTPLNIQNIQVYKEIKRPINTNRNKHSNWFQSKTMP